MVTEDNKDKLAVLWTSGDKEVAEQMVFMYTLNAKLYEWWKEITLIIWGASSRLLSEDSDLQDQVRKMKEVGIKLLACKRCADNLGVTEKLEKLGVEVIYMGQLFTQILKDDIKLLTI